MRYFHDELKPERSIALSFKLKVTGFRGHLEGCFMHFSKLEHVGLLLKNARSCDLFFTVR